MRILHENSVILDFQFLQLHCFPQTYWTGIQGEQKTAVCIMLVLVMVMSPVLPAASRLDKLSDTNENSRIPLNCWQKAPEMDPVGLIYPFHFPKYGRYPWSLSLCLIKSVQSHFKVWLIKLGNCKTPNKGRCIMGFPSLNLSVNVSKVLLWRLESSNT